MPEIMDVQQQRLFRQRVEAMKEDGFFLPQSRNLTGDHQTGTRYLIVSYGGTGAKALLGVKKQFEKIIPADQLEERVRFLAIDTDSSTQMTTVVRENADGTQVTEEEKLLEDKQFMQLRGSPARGLFNGADLPGSIQEWIDPELVKILRADIARGEQGTYLRDTGASGIRQIGRLSLYPGVTRSQIITRITTLVSEITQGTAAPLRVIILSGIAGGTGSGTVIDLTYLIRHAIAGMPGGVGSHTEYFGFIMLPTTGASTNPDDISHGNRNGYAALKEINYYMNLQQRNRSISGEDLAEKREKYSFTYGSGDTVESDSNIFSLCFLMDGVSGGVAHARPMEQVTKVIAEGLLDIATTNQITDANGNGVQCLDSFMNDAPTFLTEMLSHSSPKQKAPRDADFVYCALGHAEFSIPVHLLKTYIAKLTLDKVYRMFQNCSEVEERDAKQFVEQVGKFKGASAQEVRNQMMGLLKPIMKSTVGNKCGPWFVINLLYEVLENTIPTMERAFFKPLWANETTLGYIKEAAQQLNNKFFKTFVASLEALKALLGEQYNTVISTTPEGSTYHFMPKAMKDLEMVDAVVKHLGLFVRDSAVEEVYMALVDDAYQNVLSWTGFVSGDITASRNTIAGMRRFWNVQLDRVLKNHLQDMLVRYFAKNPNAKYDPADPESVKHLKSAATVIYNYMLGTAGLAQPMLDITGNGLTTEDLKGHTYLMVPEEAQDLVRALQEVAAANAMAQGDAVTVCTSHSSDTIACYRQFTSIPAYLLKWTQNAENDYEHGLRTPAGNGLHMSQTVGGKRWSNFPNLLPRSTWQLQPIPHKNEREAALADKAEDLFVRARAIQGVTTYEMAGVTKTYSVFVLPQQYRPAAEMFKKLDLLTGAERQAQWEAIVASAQAIAQQLCNQYTFKSENAVLTTLTENGIVCKEQPLNASPVLSYFPTNEEPENWYEYIAGTMLRKLPDTMYELEGSLLVLEALQPLVKAKLHVNVQYSQFVRYLAAGLFAEVSEEMSWVYYNKLGVKQLLCRTANKLSQAAPFYFMFKAYCEKEEVVDDILAKIYSKEYAVPADEEDDEYVVRAKAYMESGAALLAKITEWLSADPNPLDDDKMENLAEAQGVSIDAIKEFYEKLSATAELMADGNTNF